MTRPSSLLLSFVALAVVFGGAAPSARDDGQRLLTIAAGFDVFSMDTTGYGRSLEWLTRGAVGTQKTGVLRLGY